MKKTIFSGLLVITLLVFASCVPYDDQLDSGTGGGDDTTDTTLQDVVNSDFEATWQLTFYFSQTNPYKSKAPQETFENSDVKITFGINSENKLFIENVEEYYSSFYQEELDIVTNDSNIEIIDNQLRMNLVFSDYDNNTYTTRMLANKYTFENKILTKIEGVFDEVLTIPNKLTDEAGEEFYFYTWKLEKIQ